MVSGMPLLSVKTCHAYDVQNVVAGDVMGYGHGHVG